MACSVAVKRSLDIDLLHDNESPIKRRRTSAIGHYWSSPYNAQQPSSSGKRKDSGGAEMTPSKILKGDLSTDLEEDSRKFRRKIFPVFNKSSPRSTPGSPNSSSASSDSEHEHHMMDNNSNTVASAKDWNVSSPVNNQPVFTLSQVQLLCERLLKEQNEKLRDEYKQLLESRMAEQYDTFMRFNYDQLIRNFQANGTGMSYLS